jgi:hypothetical protein
MLMKTHIEKVSESGEPIMFMKTQKWLQERMFPFWGACEEKAKARIPHFLPLERRVAATL